jgi:hypothetical protein
MRKKQFKTIGPDSIRRMIAALKRPLEKHEITQNGIRDDIPAGTTQPGFIKLILQNSRFN